ncbi:hypothetical protein D3C87_1934980 [compost metagenome]
MGRPADKGCAARQDGVDGGGAFLWAQRQRNPVADSRMTDLLGLVKQAPRSLGTQFPLIR